MSLRLLIQYAVCPNRINTVTVVSPRLARIELDDPSPRDAKKPLSLEEILAGARISLVANAYALLVLEGSQYGDPFELDGERRVLCRTTAEGELVRIDEGDVQRDGEVKANECNRVYLAPGERWHCFWTARRECMEATLDALNEVGASAWGALHRTTFVVGEAGPPVADSFWWRLFHYGIVGESEKSTGPVASGMTDVPSGDAYDKAGVLWEWLEALELHDELNGYLRFSKGGERPCELPIGVDFFLVRQHGIGRLHLAELTCAIFDQIVRDGRDDFDAYRKLLSICESAKFASDGVEAMHLPYDYGSIEKEGGFIGEAYRRYAAYVAPHFDISRDEFEASLPGASGSFRDGIKNIRYKLSYGSRFKHPEEAGSGFINRDPSAFRSIADHINPETLNWFDWYRFGHEMLKSSEREHAISTVETLRDAADKLQGVVLHLCNLTDSVLELWKCVAEFNPPDDSPGRAATLTRRFCALGDAHGFDWSAAIPETEDGLKPYKTYVSWIAGSMDKGGDLFEEYFNPQAFQFPKNPTREALARLVTKLNELNRWLFGNNSDQPSSQTAIAEVRGSTLEVRVGASGPVVLKEVGWAPRTAPTRASGVTVPGSSNTPTVKLKVNVPIGPEWMGPLGDVIGFMIVLTELEERIRSEKRYEVGDLQLLLKTGQNTFQTADSMRTLAALLYGISKDDLLIGLSPRVVTFLKALNPIGLVLEVGVNVWEGSTLLLSPTGAMALARERGDSYEAIALTGKGLVLLVLTPFVLVAAALATAPLATATVGLAYIGFAVIGIDIGIFVGNAFTDPQSATIDPIRDAIAIAETKLEPRDPSAPVRVLKTAYDARRFVDGVHGLVDPSSSGE